MGSLTTASIPTAEVKVPGSDQTVTVRGLSLEDATTLFRRHGEALEHVYQSQIVEREDDFPDPQTVAKALIAAAPIAVAEMIALANENPKSTEIVRKMPITFQVDALAQIAWLTFQSEEEVKKFAETVLQGSGVLTRMIQGLTR